MRNLIIIVVSILAIVLSITAYNESSASKIYAQGQAQSMIIRASSQAQQAAMSTLFPYFVLGLGFLGLILILVVWMVISDNRNNALAEKPYVERHYIESQTIVLLGKPQDRKEFYKQLNQQEAIPVSNRIETR